ncbi:U-box domain-containing protein 52-like isoform X2 [Juglans regia]|uniref:RING-type E3 ubiquitin transferase n=1 Tax=Juglans regia TaxID=51240 RepID=A0A6P9DTP0_JUGRE|nr:U-box domain-containing protein 52-like isoform X2 [Juglans regia]
MWLAKNQVEKRGGSGLVAVAIDRDKGSQNALKWAVDNLLQRGQTVILIHVKLKSSTFSSAASLSSSRLRAGIVDESSPACYLDLDKKTKEMLLPFRCYCTRKDIHCRDIILEDTDVARALIEYTSHSAIENFVVGSSSKPGFLKFKATDIPGYVSKGAPDFCNVYVISRGKIQSMRSALRAAPSRTTSTTSLRFQLAKYRGSIKSDTPEPQVFLPATSFNIYGKPPLIEPARRFQADEADIIRSPLPGRSGISGKSYGEIHLSDTDISFVSSERPSIDRMFPSLYDRLERDLITPSRMSCVSETDDINQRYDSSEQFDRRSLDVISPLDLSPISPDSDRLSNASQSVEEVEVEMRRLKLELKQTMEMYSTACKEALTAKQMAVELQRWKLEEERRLEDARLAEEAALAIAAKEKAKSRAAIEAAEAAKRIAELEAKKRIHAEMKVLQETEEKKKAFDALAQSDDRCRRYTIEDIEIATDFFAISRKIGEGGYGPVYKCYLDHTPAAIKVLRPDAAQGRSQFQKEVEVLSCIRHPNMVLLLGACPEYGCLVYEFMANGSLEDRLFCRGNTPPLSWQLRFRIAAEVGTGLLFLHQTKPEPLVHRDLKPANILLDRNYVSKISDVGLARLVPPSVVDNVTQYRMTSTAGTFCYIDPEYQQTGMLGVKSDIYSLGIMFLQMITARPPMGLTHLVERAIEKGTFTQMLDPAVPDWPIEEALCFAKLALKCAELRRKDRPDLGKEVLPELNRLRELAEETMYHTSINGSPASSPGHSQVSLQLEGDLPPALSGESSIISLTSKDQVLRKKIGLK